MSFIDELAHARMIDLGRPLEPTTPVSPNHVPFRMALLRRHGDRVRADGSSGSNEMITLGGHTGTHLDALCHVATDGRLHGGVDALAAATGGRYTVLGVETLGPFLCRGVLLDVPATLGVESLEPGQGVTAELLGATADREGVAVEPGTAVLVRTGWPVGRYEDPDKYLGWVTGVPGTDGSGAQWLIDRRVAVAGADTIAFEQIHAGRGHAELPVHGKLLVEAGIPILEVLDLEELAAARAWEFGFVCVPLKLVGATGSPVRPLAVL